MSRTPIPIVPPVEATEIASWGALRLRFLWAYDGEVAAEHRDCRFRGGTLVAWLLRRGSVVLRCGDERYAAHAGQWLFPPAKEGWQTFTDDAQVLSVRFVAVWPDGSPLFCDSSERTMEGRDLPQLQNAASALASYVRSVFGNVMTAVQESMADLDCHLRIQELFIGFVRSYAEAMRRLGATPNLCLQHDDRLARALRCMEEWPLSRPVSEKAVAREAGLSVSQLNRLFIGKLRITPKRHFELRRMEQAAALMAYGDLPVKTVAYRLGFSSLPHFSAWFSKRFGMPPTQYRGPATGRGEI